MADTPDYSTWATKQQAADALAVSTKQIERWANAKRLQHANLPGVREGLLTPLFAALGVGVDHINSGRFARRDSGLR